MVVLRPRQPERLRGRGVRHRLEPRPLRTLGPPRLLALGDARRGELRLGRDRLPPHRDRGHGEGPHDQEEVPADGHPRSAERQRPGQGGRAARRARAGVQRRGASLDTRGRHERRTRRCGLRHAARPLERRPHGRTRRERLRSGRHVPEPQDHDRPLGRVAPHRLHLRARRSGGALLPHGQLHHRRHLSVGPLSREHTDEHHLHPRRNRGQRHRGRSVPARLRARLECDRRVDQRRRRELPRRRLLPSGGRPRLHGQDLHGLERIRGDARRRRLHDEGHRGRQRRRKGVRPDPHEPGRREEPRRGGCVQLRLPRLRRRGRHQQGHDRRRDVPARTPRPA